MSRILCLGASVVDFVFYLDALPQKAEKFGTERADIHGGGCAANAAVAISRLGGNAILAARLGDDMIGDMVIAGLASEGVDVAQVTRTEGARSSYSSVYVDDKGERQIVNFRGAGLVLNTDWFTEINDIRAVLTDTRQIAPATIALDFARDLGVPGILDGEAPVDPALLRAASHVAFSRQGLSSLLPGLDPSDAVRKIAGDYDCWACVTDGEHGVWYTGPSDDGFVPAFPITPVDTLGAGDVWHGAFALALTQGQTETDAIRFANAAAALKCQKSGGRDAIPISTEVAQFLKENQR